MATTELVQVELTKPIGFRRIGTILHVPSGTAETWFSQGRARRCVPTDEVVERMVPQHGSGIRRMKR